MRRKRLILSPPLRFSLRLSFLIPLLSCSAFQQSVGEKQLYRSREQRRVLDKLGELRQMSPKGYASAGSARES